VILKSRESLVSDLRGGYKNQTAVLIILFAAN